MGSMLLLAWTILIPAFIGMGYGFFKGKDSFSLLESYLYGYIITLALFEVIFIPMIFLKQPFDTAVKIWEVSLLLLTVISGIINGKRYPRYLLSIYKGIRKFPWWGVGFLVVIGLQITILYRYMGAYGGDKDSIFEWANTTLASNTMFRYNPYTGELFGKFPWKEALSPYSVYAATLSKLTGINTRLVIGRGLSILNLLTGYAMYFYLGNKLFENRKNSKNAIGIFLVFVMVVQVFGDTAPESASRIFLLFSWHGSAVLTNILLPFYLTLLIRLSKGVDFAGVLMLLITAAATVLTYRGSIILAAIMVLVYFIIWLVRSVMQHAGNSRYDKRSVQKL